MKTLLVVDDNKCIRDLLKMALAGLPGCSVCTAENGASAVEVFTTSHVDAVITDLSMPVMDGYQLIEYIRKRSSIPLIAMSAEAGPQVRRKLLSLGVRQCFEKPFDLPDVLQEIQSALGVTKETDRLLVPDFQQPVPA